MTQRHSDTATTSFHFQSSACFSWREGDVGLGGSILFHEAGFLDNPNTTRRYCMAYWDSHRFLWRLPSSRRWLWPWSMISLSYTPTHAYTINSTVNKTGCLDDRDGSTPMSITWAIVLYWCAECSYLHLCFLILLLRTSLSSNTYHIAEVTITPFQLLRII
jgi:hypothetical protein